MKSPARSILLTSLLLLTSAIRAEDTPVPPEVQKLAESLITAIKSSDDAALLACWHTPEVLSKVKQAEEAAEAAAEGKTKSPEDLAKDGEREMKRRTKENEDTTKRAARLRQFIAKHFGELSALTLHEVDLDVDDHAPADQTAYYGVDLFVKTADGMLLCLSPDDLVKIEGSWKFKGRLDDEIKVKLPELK